MLDELKKLCDIDPIAVAEENGGTLWDAITINTLRSRIRRQLATTLRDTHMGMSWDEFGMCVDESMFNFELVYGGDRDVIYWDDGRRLLIYADRYRDKINSGHVYGTIKCDDPEKAFTALYQCSHTPVMVRDEDGTTKNATCCYFNYDAREFLFSKLMELEFAAGFCEWEEDHPFMWLLNHEEVEEKCDVTIGHAKLGDWFPYHHLLG